MVRWDLATDEFEAGQWLFVTVKTERSELSADGKLFAYYALDYQRKPEEEWGPYVALSRPPYFTALALWFAGGMYTGGARWHGPREISAYRGEGGPPDTGSVPKDFQVRSRDAALDSWWTETAQEPVLKRASKHGVSLGFDEAGRYLLDGSPLDADWADVDHKGRLLRARAGHIVVRDAHGEHELIDLNPFEFHPLEPPEWAKQWPK